MTENTQIPAATNPNITNDSKNIAANGGEEGSFTNPQADWLGGPQNGNEVPGEAARNPQTGERYGQTKAGSDWLGGPQNGDETPGHEKKAPKGSLGGGNGDAAEGQAFIGGPQDV